MRFRLYSIIQIFAFNANAINVRFNYFSRLCTVQYFYFNKYVSVSQSFRVYVLLLLYTMISRRGSAFRHLRSYFNGSKYGINKINVATLPSLQPFSRESE
jgi:hypothetical protein